MKIRRRILHVCLAFVFFILPITSYAEYQFEEENTESNPAREPVRVEELLTSAKKWTLDTTISYANVNKSSGRSGVITIGGLLGLLQQYTIPYYLGDEKINEDFIEYMVNGRYGLTKSFEVFAFASAFSDFQRASLAGERDRTSDHDFGIAGIGATYQVCKEGKYPALLLSASTNIAENVRYSENTKINTFKTFSASLTSYHTVDPIIFFLQATYKHSLEKKVDDDTMDDNTLIEPGPFLSLSPQILFVVNPFVTLAGGVRWTAQGGTKINGESISSTSTNISPVFGVSYGIRDNQILSLDTEFKNQADYDQSTVSLRLTSRF